MGNWEFQSPLFYHLSYFLNKKPPEVLFFEKNITYSLHFYAQLFHIRLILKEIFKAKIKI